MRLAHKWTFFIASFIVFHSLAMTSVSARENYKFQWVCSDSGGTSYSVWMDERVSNKMTIDERIYLSCDRVAINIRPVDGWFDINSPYQTRDMTYMWRQYAPIDDDPNASIRWSTASELGEADGVTFCSSCSSSTNYHALRSFTWTTSWPDSYWFVYYERGGGTYRFRTKVRFEDPDGINHYFYAVPAANE
jgi:hypothetical protein